MAAREVSLDAIASAAPLWHRRRHRTAHLPSPPRSLPSESRSPPTTEGRTALAGQESICPTRSIADQEVLMSTNSPGRILRLKSVLERTGLSPSTLYRKIQLGTFPKQLRISTRCAGWRESEVDAWVNNPVFYSTTGRHRDLLGLD
ncbi:MAG TPA: AlpA family phage regulatory protein [Allosphingosinicella sp.]